MITADILARLLHSVSTGYPDRALNLIATDANLEDAQRATLSGAVQLPDTPAAQARALGDTFLRLGADQAIVNECYRCAFYAGDGWQTMAEDPLYAQFAANRAGAILDKWVHYFPIYSRHLAAYRGRKLRVLEIGVYMGGGLAMWSRYLGAGATLVGLDVDEAAVRAVRGRFPVVLGDQEDPEVLRNINDKYGPFDLVIDDGGHTMGQQKVSVETLFPLLAEGGTYIVEDCHTSYWPEFDGGLRKPDSFIEWAKARIDDLHARHDNTIDSDSVWATEVDGVHFYDSVVVLDKAHRFRPFNEVAGTSSFVFAERFNEIIGNELVATRDAALRERDELRAAIAAAGGEVPVLPAPGVEADGEILLLRAELARSRAVVAERDSEHADEFFELVRTRNQLLESWEQIHGMRHTFSWRITAPLRVVRRMRRR